MKLVSLFDDFLKDTVNLNQTRIDLLENSISALKTFIRGSDWKPRIRGFEEQGSWAHRTIIRPVDGDEFDADLLVMVDPVEGWAAADYVEELGRVFAASGTYAEKTKVWDYCVTVTYACDRMGCLDASNRLRRNLRRDRSRQAATGWRAALNANGS